jgi:hypothetical protein
MTGGDVRANDLKPECVTCYSNQINAVSPSIEYTDVLTSETENRMTYTCYSFVISYTVSSTIVS